MPAHDPLTSTGRDLNDEMLRFFQQVTAPPEGGLEIPVLTDPLAQAGEVAPRVRWWNGGVAGNYWATPDDNAFDFAGDVEIVCLVALADYTPAAAQILVSKRTAGAGLAFQLALHTTGTLRWSFRTGALDKFDDGILTPPAALVDGTPYWLKFTRVAATGVIAGGYAPASLDEPSSWTAWTPSGARSVGAIDANAAEVAVGGERAGTTVLNGAVYRAILRDGIGGATVGDLRLDGPMDRYRDSAGKVWTGTGSAWAWEVPAPLA